MELNELMSISTLLESKKISFREAMDLALMNELNVFYVMEGFEVVEFHDTKTMQIITSDFEGGEIFRLPREVIKKLWINGECTFSDLLNEGYQKDLEVNRTWEWSGPKTITTDNIFIEKRHFNRPNNIQKTDSNGSKTALKVIALLMYHLSKSPKYASGSSPNKSQIKELLLELAVELEVNPYGLSKVDERILAEAMKYLEEQKL